MRICLLAPLGALLACAPEGTSDDPESIDPGTEETTEVDLTGGYATCNEALVGHGITPWIDYVEEETAHYFQVDVDDEGAANTRPWVATRDAENHVTCGDNNRGEAFMWVKPGQEYWTCTFTAQVVGIFDPESDPDCSRGLSKAYRADADEEEVYEYDMVDRGHFVQDE